VVFHHKTNTKTELWRCFFIADDFEESFFPITMNRICEKDGCFKPVKKKGRRYCSPQCAKSSITGFTVCKGWVEKAKDLQDKKQRLNETFFDNCTPL
jgi:hypothetical protein